jgi:hypothetical protein
MADAEDLKSSGPNGPCGFESRPRHQQIRDYFGIGLFGGLDHSERLTPAIEQTQEFVSGPMPPAIVAETLHSPETSSRVRVV